MKNEIFTTENPKKTFEIKSAKEYAKKTRERIFEHPFQRNILRFGCKNIFENKFL